MSKGHRPHHNFPRPTLRGGELGGVSQPGKGTAPTGHNFTAWTHCASHPRGVPAGGAVVAPPAATVNVGLMTAGSHLPGVLVHRRPRKIPRPAPDAYSAGTRNRGGAVHKITAPPHHSAPRENVG